MTTEITLSDDALDKAIRADVDTLRRALGSAVTAAWELGRKLTVRKRRMDHGAWLPYLASVGLPARTAQEAMAIGTKYAAPAYLPGTIRARLHWRANYRRSGRRAQNLRL